MEMSSFYRVGIQIINPSKLGKNLQELYFSQFSDYKLFLGVRFNLALEKQSAAINSMDLANRYIESAKRVLARDVGEVKFYVSTHQYSGDQLKSIIDTDSALLLSNIERIESDGQDLKSDKVSSLKVGSS